LSQIENGGPEIEVILPIKYNQTYLNPEFNAQVKEKKRFKINDT